MVLVPWYYLIESFNKPHDSREPQLIGSMIPIWGHVVGLLRHGTAYYVDLAKKSHLPIFTIQLPKNKLYVVTSPDLITSCDRRSKLVSFAPYIVEFARRILMASPMGIQKLSEGLNEENGANLRTETMQAMHQVMRPGQILDDTMQAVLKHAMVFLNVSEDIMNETEVPLFLWCRRFVTMASTDTLYGAEMNPFQFEEVMEGFWAVDRDFALLGLMLRPELIAAEASRGRQRFFEAFRVYYASGGLEFATHVIKARYEVNRKYGIAINEIAQYDLGVCTALLVNTVPATFWVLYRVFSTPDLLQQVRSDIENSIKHDVAMLSTKYVDVHRVYKDVPLLESLVKEELRVQSNNAAARYLLEDTSVSDGKGSSYLLRKDSFLVMPSATVHQDNSVWGSDASSFDASRFISKPRIPTNVYRAFGGGNSLCPGRHFAFYEIISILVTMVLKYDIEPVNDGWEVLKTSQHIATSILTPLKDIRVTIKPRKDSDLAKCKLTWV